MANAFDSYSAAGPAEPGQVRRAAAWDAGLVAVVFMVLWPTPAFRLTAGLPWSVHIPLMLAGLVVVWWLYSLTCALALRRTVGMYLADVGFAGGDAGGFATAARWALGWTAALLPTAFGARAPADGQRGWAARLSGLTLVSTRPA
jgi:hypothetical protein